MRDFPTIADGYINRVMDGTELVCRKVRLTIERHVRDLERSKTNPSYPFFFDPKPGVRFCRLFEGVNPSKWPSKMVMSPWMVACTLILYGWKHKKAAETVNESGVRVSVNPRRFRRAFLMWPRKMGKSAYLSVGGINALIADGEKGAEVYSAGIVEKQARRVFDEAAAMVDSTPALRKLIVKSGQMPCRSMHNPKAPNSEFRPLSRDKDAIQGTNPSFAACDEVHVWNGRGVYDDIRWGMRARLQPLLVAITTAPSSDDTNEQIAVELYEFSTKVLEGVIEDDSFFCWITELDGEIKNAAGEVIQEADHWDDETKWVKACPNLGVTVKIEDMRQEALEARNSAGSLNAFQRYSLNLRVDALMQAISTADWDRCAAPIHVLSPELRLMAPQALRKLTLEKMAGRICFAALDLALTDDTSALVLAFPPMEPGERWRLVPFFWIPADNIRARVDKHRVPYDLWRDQGFLITTPGKVTDYDFICGAILDISRQFDLRELAYDPALASGLITQVLAGRTRPAIEGEATPPGWVRRGDKFQQQGLKKDTVVKFAQNPMNYAAPCGDFVRSIARLELAHDADPVLRWQVTNLRWKKNHTGLIMPDKEKSIEKIDGVVAAIMAYGRATHPDNAKLIKGKPKVTVL